MVHTGPNTPLGGDQGALSAAAYQPVTLAADAKPPSAATTKDANRKPASAAACTPALYGFPPLPAGAVLCSPSGLIPQPLLNILSSVKVTLHTRTAAVPGMPEKSRERLRL